MSEVTFPEVVARLTGPEAPFELEEVPAPGGPVRNFVRRERSLRDLIERSARRGDVEFLVQGERRLSFARFAAQVRGTSRALVDRAGLAPGDRVAVLGANSIDWLLATFAASSAGGVAVALNSWWTADELGFALNDCGARFLAVDAGLLERIEPLRHQLPDLEQIFVIGGAAPPDTMPFSELVNEMASWPAVEIAEEDPFVILYTSGTTGQPKGCVTTHQGTIAQVRVVILSAVIDRELSGEGLGGGAGRDRQPALLATSPLFHVSGLHSAVCLALATGTKLVLTTGRFDPAEVVRLIERERITAWGGVPTMVHRVVDCPEAAAADLSSLETVSIGGAPLPPDVLARARALLGLKSRLGNGYGLTETHGAITMNAGKSLIERPSSVGRPSPVVDLRIVAETGDAVPTGVIGEVLVHGVTVTPGYWNRPAENAETLCDGWLRTGDLGYLDDDGFLHLVDRLKDMIIRGGENIYCTQVEDCLTSLAEVDEAAVFGVPDPDLGERVEAVVRLTAGAEVTEDDLRAFLAGSLARYKIPDRIEITDQPLPRNATGKVVKDQLRGRRDAPVR